ncbi:hypothetical protein Scep_002056 [Stephania cephalantha]|uniref:Armadillo repeat-containing protein 6 n=1 Tax=Stephania cephalantha TaxID=152367 RepID=A0AAP0LAA8_9MAGN
MQSELSFNWSRRDPAETSKKVSATHGQNIVAFPASTPFSQIPKPDCGSNMVASSKNVRTISQEAFDGLVKENMEDLGMDPAEALQDAIEALTLQGVDLSGIVTCIPGVSSISDDSVIQCLDRLKEFDSKLGSRESPSTSGEDFEEIANILDRLWSLCSVEESGNASIATRNGGLDLVISICSTIDPQCGRALDSVLKAMSSLIHNVQTTEIFWGHHGPKLVMDILTSCNQNTSILDNGFLVVAAAATGNELVKESFMELKIDEFLLHLLRGKNKGHSQSFYDVIHALLTPDDGRVVASQVYGYARRFAEIGIAQELVDEFHEELSSVNLVSACTALKTIAVNRFKSHVSNYSNHQSPPKSSGVLELERAIVCSKWFVSVLQSFSTVFGRCGIQGSKTIRIFKLKQELLDKIWNATNANEFDKFKPPLMDEICRLIAQSGGIDAVLQCIDDSGAHGNKAVSRSFCSLLSKLAGSDSNKSDIVQKGGINRLMKLSSQFSEDPSVLQEIMAIITVLSLRSPANAACAMEAGAGDLAIEAMKKFHAYQMQRQSCLMIRNLVVRNPENRAILLGNGIEKIIRKAKESHESCKDAASAALRDLGLDNYNS